MSDSVATAASISSDSRQKSSSKPANNALAGSAILNFEKSDPFANGGFDDDLEEKTVEKSNKIHIRIQQRNGRKTLTTLQGLNPEFDFKRLLKAFKKVFACNGTIVEDEEFGDVIQLQGDQRQKIKAFLLEEGICKKGDLEVHGF